MVFLQALIFSFPPPGVLRAPRWLLPLRGSQFDIHSVLKERSMVGSQEPLIFVFNHLSLEQFFRFSLPLGVQEGGVG